MKPDIVVKADTPTMGWGSDVIAELLRRLGIKYVCINPGSSFRGLHDSLVNYLGNEKPQMLLALHEQSVVAIAHGYYKASGEPMVVVLHSNVGLMAGMMSIFNAWCDRAPMLILGATGAVDSAVRRSWIDWSHTLRDQGALVRHFVKWDEQPQSPQASVDSVLRAFYKSCSSPCGPSYVILDRRLQEDALDKEIVIPPVEQYRPPGPVAPSPAMVRDAVAMLSKAKSPVIMLGRVSRSMADWNDRILLAELLQARVVTDLRQAASFPTEHPLHGGPADLFLSPSDRTLLGKADVVLSLDWPDLADALLQADCKGKVIQVSLDGNAHNAFSGDHQRLCPTDLEIPVMPDAVLRPLIAALEGLPKRVSAQTGAGKATARQTPASPPDAMPTLTDIGHALSSVRGNRKICLARLPLNWPAPLYHFREPLDYLGYDGGGGVGSGPGMAVGAALALQGTGRLPVAIMGDGEFLGASSALWTAAHYRIPLLTIVANNRSYFTDEIQQEIVAKERGRPAENRWIGQQIDNPAVDLTGLARDFGIEGEGPVEHAGELAAAIERGLRAVEGGRPYFIDVRVDPSRGGSFDWLSDA
jgi:thiamine pyrophosphate-dependent acetolactate synthase large subunit-like protein